ncbi:MAG: carboxymuconolactone decarboxylase family protein [Candidatus Dormibacteria bacterium]
MNRLPAAFLDGLDPAQRELLAAITGGPRRGSTPLALVDERGRVVGPFGPMLLQPAVGDPVQRLGAALRYSGRLTAEHREVATLVVAHHQGSVFEVAAHEPLARAVGVPADTITALRTGNTTDLPLDHAVVAHTVLALLEPGQLDDAEYATAQQVFGAEGLFELVVLVSYYRLLAQLMRVFDTDRDDTAS